MAESHAAEHAHLLGMRHTCQHHMLRAPAQAETAPALHGMCPEAVRKSVHAWRRGSLLVRKSCSRVPVLQVQGPVTRTRSHAGAAAAAQKAVGATGSSAADASAPPGRATGCDLGALVPCKSLSAFADPGICWTSCRTVTYMQCARVWLMCNVLDLGCITHWTVHWPRPLACAKVHQPCPCPNNNNVMQAA